MDGPDDPRSEGAPPSRQEDAGVTARTRDAPPWAVAVAVVAAAVLLLSLLAAGSSALRSGPRARELVDPSDAGQAFTVVLAVGAGIAVAFFVPMVVAVIPSLRLGDRDVSHRRLRRWRLIAGVVTFLAISSVAPSVVERPEQPETPPVQGQAATARAERERREPGAAGIDLWIVGAGFGLGVLAAAVLLARTRARPGTMGPDDEVPDAARPRAVDASLDAIAEEADPRRAVILAYVRMEETLGEQGVPRAVWETPREYLARVFADLGPRAAAAARLTELYEEAHFADHRVAEEMRRAAQESLLELRAALGVAA